MNQNNNWPDWLPQGNSDSSLEDSTAAGIGAPAPTRPTAKPAKPFDVYHAVPDIESFGQPAPKGAKQVNVPGIQGGAFVPVSFVAKDWQVTPRRIRALLAAGRLAGRLQENGYWEVRFPYSFTFGTRGPGLKRQQKPKKQPKKPVLRAV